jgi:hypothetical protein
MRWQRFMILVTLVLSTLLTSIWCVGLLTPVLHWHHLILQDAR